MQSPDDLEMSRRELLEHVPIEFGQQLAHLSTSPAGLSRGSRFTAKIIGMAGTSPIGAKIRQTRASAAWFAAFFVVAAHASDSVRDARWFAVSRRLVVG